MPTRAATSAQRSAEPADATVAGPRLVHQAGVLAGLAALVAGAAWAGLRDGQRPDSWGVPSSFTW